MSIFKAGYTLPQVQNKWLTFEEGQVTRIRVLSDIRTGYLFWTDAEGNVLERPQKGCTPVHLPDEAREQLPPVKYKYWWAFAAWEYTGNRLVMAKLTQRTILEALFEYYQDAEWGDFRNFDVSITRQGSGLDSSYKVKVYTPKPVEESILKAYRSAKIDLDALYKGKSPWGDDQAETGQPESKANANGAVRSLVQANGAYIAR